MSFDIAREFVRCGSVVSTYARGEYLELVEMCMETNPSMDDVFDILTPDRATTIRSSNHNRFDVLKTCVFKLASGEFVRIHCHTADKRPGAVGNTVNGPTCRLNIDGEIVYLENGRVKTALLDKEDSRWDHAHMPLKRDKCA